MELREITVTLPDGLAAEAETNGLFTPDSLEQIIREESKRRKTAHLFDRMDCLAVANKGELTEADVAAEIHAYRAEKRADPARGD
jgi:hypothetical protein